MRLRRSLPGVPLPGCVDSGDRRSVTPVRCHLDLERQAIVDDPVCDRDRFLRQPGGLLAVPGLLGAIQPCPGSRAGPGARPALGHRPPAATGLGAVVHADSGYVLPSGRDVATVGWGGIADPGFLESRV